jgi:hypothetical protein
MRAALDEVMTTIPVDQATPSIKVHMAELILKAAADGQTSYEGLLAAASDQIQTILSVQTQTQNSTRNRPRPPSN